MAKDYSNEKWLPVVGYEGLYQVSDYGRVKQLSTKKGSNNATYKMRRRIKKPLKHPHGYYMTVLCNKKRLLIHRLVAMAFIPNPNNYPIINHKNLKKNDNHVDNLEWCTHSHNTQHYFNSPKAKTKSKKKAAFLMEYAEGTRYGVNVYKDGLFVAYYKGVSIAAKELKLKSKGNIYSVLCGQYKQTGGYTFEKVPNPEPYQPKTKRTNKSNKAKELLTSIK